jgi:hypothetical protein
MDQNGHLRFGGFAKVVYDLNSDRPAEMATYSIDGRIHSTPIKKLAVDKVPALLFQMVDEGYTVSMDEKEGSVRCIIAVSQAAQDHLRRQMKA